MYDSARGIPNNNFSSRLINDAFAGDVEIGVHNTEQNTKRKNGPKILGNTVKAVINGSGSSANGSDPYEMERKKQLETMPGGGPPRRSPLLDGVPEQAQHPQAQYPQAQYPQAQYLQAQYPQAQYDQGQPMPSRSFFSPTTRKYICAAIGVVGGSAVGVGAYIGYRIAHKKLVEDGLLDSNSPPWNG